MDGDVPPAMDEDVPPFTSREGEEVIFGFMRQNPDGAEDSGAEDGSQFLNESGPRMEEPERSVDAQTSTECNDDLQLGKVPPQSGEVY